MLQNEIGHQLTLCWCPGGDGGGCVQGCDATGEHYQITLSAGFLGSEQLYFLDQNNCISWKGTTVFLWLNKCICKTVFSSMLFLNNAFPQASS